MDVLLDFSLRQLLVGCIPILAISLGFHVLSGAFCKKKYIWNPFHWKPHRDVSNGGRSGTGEEGNDALRDPKDPSARIGYLSWDEYFMAVAFLSAKRSKDPKKQVGACIVNSENVTMGMGYNGFPRGCADNLLPWAQQGETSLSTKYPYVVHAEANAILNKNSASLAGTRIFVTTFPCNECTKLIIQSGITEVIYHEDKLSGNISDTAKAEKYEASRQMLTMAGIHCRQYIPGKTVVLKM